MAQFTFVKNSNKSILEKEIGVTELKTVISDITIQGNVLVISTNRNLNKKEEEKLYNVIALHNPPSNTEKAVQQKVTAAMQFGQQFMIEFATENIILGFTTDQILRMLIKYGHIQAMMLSGSLYTALDAIQSIPPDDLISQVRKEKYVKKIKAFLGLT